jgi:hypothetical protein
MHVLVVSNHGPSRLRGQRNQDMMAITKGSRQTELTCLLNDDEIVVFSERLRPGGIGHDQRS